MVHHEEISNGARPVNPGRLAAPLAWLLAVMAVVVGTSACEGSTTVVPSPLLAEIGELRADVEVPLADGTGRLEGTLLWASDGRWVMVERIYFRNVLGEEVVRRSRTNPGERAPEYAGFVRQLNETPALRLPGEVPDGGPTSCAPTQARVTFTMADDFRNQVVQWTRCAAGNLFTLSTLASTPSSSLAGTVRVVTAAQLLRSFTIGDAERSVFEGSIPFGTLDRGADSPAREPGSRAFVPTGGTPPPEWTSFWLRHAGPGVPEPTVDWASEMVLLATPGRRMEAGHEVGVRRVLPVGVATQVQAVESIPGDFCAPASLDRWPFHLVRAPLGPPPVTFADLLPQRVACGG